LDDPNEAAKSAATDFARLLVSRSAGARNGRSEEAYLVGSLDHAGFRQVAIAKSISHWSPDRDFPAGLHHTRSEARFSHCRGMGRQNFPSFGPDRHFPLPAADLHPTGPVDYIDHAVKVTDASGIAMRPTLDGDPAVLQRCAPFVVWEKARTLCDNEGARFRRIARSIRKTVAYPAGFATLEKAASGHSNAMP